MEEVIAVDSLAETVDLIVQIRGKGGKPQRGGAYLDGEAFPLVGVATDRQTRQTGWSPVSVELTIQQGRIPELGAQIGIHHPSRHVHIAPARPIEIVGDPGLDHWSG